jgi:hypothetical protein
MNSQLFTNLRDKIALAGIILFGILSFVTVWIILIFGKTETAVVVAMISQITTIVAILGTIFKGTPTPPATSTITETATSTITPPKEETKTQTPMALVTPISSEVLEQK